MMKSESNGLIPTCKEVHRLVSEQLDRELSLAERVRLRLHLLICDACSSFNGQMQLLRKAMRQWSLPDAMDDDRDPQ